jgi:hypothetical protein
LDPENFSKENLGVDFMNQVWLDFADKQEQAFALWLREA